MEFPRLIPRIELSKGRTDNRFEWRFYGMHNGVALSYQRERKTEIKILYLNGHVATDIGIIGLCLPEALFNCGVYTFNTDFLMFEHLDL